MDAERGDRFVGMYVNELTQDYGDEGREAVRELLSRAHARRLPRRVGAVSRAVVLAGIRTPIGRYGGALSGERPDDLAGLVIREVVERSGVPAEEIEDVWFGCANQAGEDNRNVARMGALLAGLPQSVAGVTVNRLCASGLSAVVGACHAVARGRRRPVRRRRRRVDVARAVRRSAKPDKAFPRGNQTL